MPYYLSEESSPIARRMITMDVFKTPGVERAPMMSVQVCLMDVDDYARKMSQLVHPTGGRVRLVEDARVRAVYVNGQRVQDTDMREFYTMTDEAHAESRILCSVSREYF